MRLNDLFYNTEFSDADLNKSMQLTDATSSNMASPCSSAPDASLCETIRESVRRCAIPGWVLAVLTRRVYSMTSPVELLTDDASPIATSTRPLRAYMYALLGLASVTEKIRHGLQIRDVVAMSAPEAHVASACGTTGLRSLLSKPLPEREMAFCRLVDSISAAETDKPPTSASSTGLHAIDSRCSHVDGTVGIEDSITVGFTQNFFGITRSTQVAIPLAKIRAWIQYACRAAPPSICLTEREAKSAIATCMLLHMGLDATKLPQHTSNMDSAVAVSYLSECADALFGLASLLDVAHMVPQPKVLVSGRLFAHIHDSTPIGKVICRMWTRNGAMCPDLYEEVCAKLLRDIKFHPQTLAAPAIQDSKSDVVSDYQRGEFLPQGMRLTGGRKIQSELQGARATGGVVPSVSDARDRGQAGGERRDGGVRGDADKQHESGKLPIEEHRDAILARIEADLVTTIHGETGCGKSTMVPLFVLQDALKKGNKVNIVVAQPRRIAAISLAKRVAHMLGEELGKSVGFRLGLGERVGGSDVKINFCTSGWLLQTLAHSREKVQWLANIQCTIHLVFLCLSVLFYIYK